MKPTIDGRTIATAKVAASLGRAHAADPPLRLDREDHRATDRQERPEQPDQEAGPAALRDGARHHRRRPAAGPRREAARTSVSGAISNVRDGSRRFIRTGQRQPVRRRVDVGLRDRPADPEAGDRGVAPGVRGIVGKRAGRPGRGEVGRDLRIVEAVRGSVGDVGAGRIGQRRRRGPPGPTIVTASPGSSRVSAIRPTAVRVAHARPAATTRTARGRAAARRRRRRGRPRRSGSARRVGCRARPARRPTSPSRPRSATVRRTAPRAGRPAGSRSRHGRGSRSTVPRRSRVPGLVAHLRHRRSTGSRRRPRSGAAR